MVFRKEDGVTAYTYAAEPKPLHRKAKVSRPSVIQLEKTIGSPLLFGCLCCVVCLLFFFVFGFFFFGLLFCDLLDSKLRTCVFLNEFLSSFQ
jgi:hypothetical protein